MATYRFLWTKGLLHQRGRGTDTHRHRHRQARTHAHTRSPLASHHGCSGIFPLTSISTPSGSPAASLLVVHWTQGCPRRCQICRCHSSPLPLLPLPCFLKLLDPRKQNVFVVSFSTLFAWKLKSAKIVALTIGATWMIKKNLTEILKTTPGNSTTNLLQLEEVQSWIDLIRTKFLYTRLCFGDSSVNVRLLTFIIQQRLSLKCRKGTVTATWQGGLSDWCENRL